MRVLQITGEYYDTLGRGIGSYTYHLSKHLTALGHNVDVVTYIRGNLRADIRGVKVYNVPLSRFPLWRMLKWGFEASAKLSHIVKNYDLVHAHMPSCFGYPTSHRYSLPLVVTAHTTYRDPLSPQWLKPYTFLRDKFSYRQADRIITVSKAIMEELVKIGINPLKVEHIPVGVDLERFHPSDNYNKTEFLTSLHRDSNSFVLLYVGTLNKRKGVQYLLEAIRLLPESIKKRVSVAVIGTGPLLSHYERRYSSLRNITFYGFIADTLLPLFYRSADVFVCPSLYEGLPTVVLEAIASGLPIIATNIPSLAEVVKPDFGILVDPRDPHGIAQAITFMTRNADIRQEMARKALTHSKKYDWRHVALRMSKVYEQIV